VHRGFLADTPSADTSGALFEPVKDGRGVAGGWRDNPDSGGPFLAAVTSMMALPIEMAMLPLRMADIGMTMAAPILEAMMPTAARGPVSR